MLPLFVCWTCSGLCEALRLCRSCMFVLCFFWLVFLFLRWFQHFCCNLSCLCVVFLFHMVFRPVSVSVMQFSSKELVDAFEPCPAQPTWWCSVLSSLHISRACSAFLPDMLCRQIWGNTIRHKTNTCRKNSRGINFCTNTCGACICTRRIQEIIPG